MRETTADKAAMAKEFISKAKKKGKVHSNKQLRKTFASLLEADEEKESNTASEFQEIQKYLVSFMSGNPTSAVLPLIRPRIPLP